MKIAVIDDYQDAFRKLACAAKLKGHDITVYRDTEKDAARFAARLSAWGATYGDEAGDRGILGKGKLVAHIGIYGDDYPTSDGTCIRDYVHVTDLAQAHLLALESPLSGSFNIGSGNGFSVKEIIEATRQVTGHPIPAQVSPRRAGDPAFLISDSTAARTQLGWKPQHDDIRTIIADAWNWRLRNPNGYKG